MRDYERTGLLERIERDGATVGTQIPATIEVQGRTVDLKSFVFEVKSLDGVPPDQRGAVAEMKTALRRERTVRKQTLQESDLTREEGETLVEEIVGIDRALNALEALGPTDIEGEAAASEAADRKRWTSFLRSVLGHDCSGAGQGGQRR